MLRRRVGNFVSRVEFGQLLELEHKCAVTSPTLAWRARESDHRRVQSADELGKAQRVDTVDGTRATGAPHA